MQVTNMDKTIKKFYLILLIISGTEFIFSGDGH